MRIGAKGFVLVMAAAALAAAAPAHALKVATWNLTSYTDPNVAPRQADFRTAMAAMNPDILVTQEMNSAAAKDSFLLDVLGVVQPGQWSGSWVDVGSGEGMGIFWKTATCAISNLGAFSTSGPRKVLQCLVKPTGYLTNPGWFRLYSFHLKAGNSCSPLPCDTTRRRLECTDIRTTINNVPLTVVGPNFLLGGDSNFYGSWEGGYIRLTESQADNDGRCKDWLTMPGTWNSSAYATAHTQSPCLTCPYGYFSGGGLDDRFDLLFSSTTLQDGSGLDYDSYIAYGNDGVHYNRDVNADGFNFAVGYTVATALWGASDHLPALLTLRLPARISAASALAFGSVIVGATASQPLAVANAASVPGDSLRYSFTAPSGFTAPADTFAQAAGAPATSQAIGMSTAAAGVKSGTLAVATNDPDTLSKSVLLSGTVLRHAAASLDSLSVLLADTLDFGDVAPASFVDRVARVYDQGYDALQARLAVTAGVVAGGGGHFSIVGGFSPALVAGTPAAYTVHFDTTGVAADSTYYATLTFSSADEALPGGQPQPDLVITLRARPINANVDTPVGPPAALRFYPPRPNPAARMVRFAFDLPKSAPVTLEVFDLAGRRVASVVAGEVGAGHHELPWDAVGPQGRATAGLYYVRFSTPGLTRTTRLVLLP